MRVASGVPDYNDLTLWRIKRFAENMRDKEGLEELADPAVGPDVKYVLNTNDIELVKRYLRSPITVEEYRELRYKLLQLQLQRTTVSEKDQPSPDKARATATIFNLTPAIREHQESGDQSLDQKNSLVDLVA